MKLYQRDDWETLAIHPEADRFPMMSDDALLLMAEDMQTNGFSQDHPILMYDGVLIDGRNRLAACKLSRVKPWLKDYEKDDPVAEILRANLNRRHLDIGQRAAIATDLYPAYQAEAKERMRAGGGDRKSEEAKSGSVSLRYPIGEADSHRSKAVILLAKEAHVGETTMQRTILIQREDEVLFEEVKQGKRTVGNAYRTIRKRKEQQKPVELTTPNKVKSKPKHPRQLDLSQRETIIESKMEAFLDVAYELLVIRQERLYIDQYGQFETYLRDRWGVPFSRGKSVACAIDALTMMSDKERGR